MANATVVNDLMERLRKDCSDNEGVNPHSWGLTDYLETVLKDDNFTNPAAIGSARQAISEGVLSLSDNQLKAISLDLINNEVYMERCLNEGCGEGIAWGDMNTALYEGQCYHCVNRKESYDRD